MTTQTVTYRAWCLILWGLLLFPAQTADELTKLIDRLANLDSIDLTQFEVKSPSRLS